MDVAQPAAKRIDPAELAGIAERGVVREFPARALVVTEGDRTDALYIILEGRMRAFLSDASGREVVLATLEPGEFFGEVAFDAGPRSASVITLEKCRVVVVPRHELEAFIVAHPTFAIHFIHKLLARIRSLTQNVRSLALMDAFGRVARLLLESSVARDGKRIVPERPTQQDIAARVGCSREMVSRILKDLVTDGYITLERDHIVIHREPPSRG